MASVQEVETRLIGIENMLKFVLTLFSTVDATNPFAKPTTLLDAYYKSLQASPSPIILPTSAPHPAPVDVVTE